MDNKIFAAHNNGQSQGWRYYFHNHRLAFAGSWQTLQRHPLMSFITIVMIALALALPTSLWVLLENTRALSHVWSDNTQITLYLKMNISAEQAHKVVTRLQRQAEVATVTYISPAQGLAEFEQQTGLSNVKTILHRNPLPGVIIVEPTPDATAPAVMTTLLQQVRHLPEVDHAMMDSTWIKRLTAWLTLGKHLSLALGLLLASIILLIIGNAISLSLQKYREEMTVLHFIGATPQFIRRPFLYLGCWYGLGGALLACGIVMLLLTWINPSVQQLSLLYQSHFRLQSFSLSAFVCLLLLGACLGVAGAYGAALRRGGAAHEFHTNLYYD